VLVTLRAQSESWHERIHKQTTKPRTQMTISKNDGSIPSEMKLRCSCVCLVLRAATTPSESCDRSSTMPAHEPVLVDDRQIEPVVLVLRRADPVFGNESEVGLT
jgi:hypothetical protein